MLKFAANLSMLFTEHDFLQRFGAAAAVGFKYVECLFPYTSDKADIAHALRSHRLQLVLHDLPLGSRAACDPEGTAEFRDGVALAIEYAGALQCAQLNCLAGVLPDGVDTAAGHAAFVANLRFAAAECAKAGIRLLIEPINTRDKPGYFLSRTQQALELIADVGSDNLFLQYDVYHMQVMEGDLARCIEANLARISHIQISNNPGRHEPGSGEINFAFLFSFLERIGYAGYIGAEYHPAAGTLAGLAWIEPYLAVQ
jgi:hydroxypyruvate isomerase